MMGVADTTLASHRAKFLDGKPMFRSYKHSRLDVEAWNRFINGEEDKDAVVAEKEGIANSDNKKVEDDNPADTTFLPSNKAVSKADIANGSMNLRGKADDIFRKMTDILGCENEYEIYVCFKSIRK